MGEVEVTPQQLAAIQAGNTPMTSSVAMPNYFQGEKGDLLDKIRPEEIVEIYRNKLLGKDFINGEWVVIPELKGRALSFLGAWEIANLMLSASSQNVSISNLTDQEIKKRTRSTCRTSMIMCLRNWREYGITGADQYYFVKEIVMTNTLVSLKQPMHEGIRKLLKGTTQEQKQIVENTNENKGGMGKLLKGMIRK